MVDSKVIQVIPVKLERILNTEFFSHDGVFPFEISYDIERFYATDLLHFLLESMILVVVDKYGKLVLGKDEPSWKVV